MGTTHIRTTNDDMLHKSGNKLRARHAQSARRHVCDLGSWQVCARARIEASVHAHRQPLLAPGAANATAALVRERRAPW